MPANLTPDYRAAEAAFRKARDPRERLEPLVAARLDRGPCHGTVAFEPARREHEFDGAEMVLEDIAAARERQRPHIASCSTSNAMKMGDVHGGAGFGSPSR